MKSINLDTNDKRSVVIPKSTQYYHQNKKNIERIRTYRKNRYLNMSNDEKEKRKEYTRKYGRNLSNEQKEKVKEYQKKKKKSK